jgi:hypothetical protein
MPKWAQCPECKVFFPPDHPTREAGCCSRHCARIRDARHGVPSQEDKEARFSDGVMKLFHDIFKPKE